MSLSPEENRLLSRIGFALLFNFANLCPQLILYGIYVCIFTFAVIALWRKSFRNPSIVGLLLAISIIFVVSTLQLASRISVLVIEFQQYLIDGQDPLTDRGDSLDDMLVSPFTIEVVSDAVVFVLADTIVMWRAWVLYSNNLAARVFMATLMLANSVVFFCLAGLASKDILAYEDGAYPILNSAATFLSVATNVTATAFICFKFWRHRKDMNNTGDRKTRAQGVLILLVETGLGFVVIQAVNAFLQRFDTESGTPLDQATTIINQLTLFFSAILPTLIVTIVNWRDLSIVGSTIAAPGSSFQTGRFIDYSKPSNSPNATVHLGSIHPVKSVTQSMSTVTISQEEKTEV